MLDEVFDYFEQGLFCTNLSIEQYLRGHSKSAYSLKGEEYPKKRTKTYKGEGESSKSVLALV